MPTRKLLVPFVLIGVSLFGGLSPGLGAAGRATQAAPSDETGQYGTLTASATTNPRTLAAAPDAPQSSAPDLSRKPRRPEAAVGRSGIAQSAPAVTGTVVIDPTGGPAPRAPTSGGATFAGLGSTSNTLGYRPPDPILAVGPNQIIEMTNVNGRIFDKAGATLSTFSLASFFGVTAGWAEADPKVIFDPLSNRFFATYFSYIDNPSGSDFATLHIAVSTTPDPRDPWRVSNTSFTNDFPDYESIAVSSDKVTVSWNRFDIDATTNPYIGAQTLVLEKSTFMAGGATATFMTAPNPSYFTIRPAQTMTTSSAQFMVSADYPNSSIVHLWKITGTPAAANVSVADIAQPAIDVIGAPPVAQASGTVGGIDNGDDRILDAVWRNGSLWFAASSGCIFSGPDPAIRTCVKLTQIDTTTNAVLQDTYFGALGAYSYFPALKTDGAGNLVFVFTRSASTLFPQVRVAGRLTSDPLNTIGASVLLKAGEIAYNPPAAPGEPPYRWGDYSGAAIDPTDASRIWVVGEYSKNDGFIQWGTWIGSFVFDTDGDGIGDVVDNCPTVANPSQTNTDAQPLIEAGAPNDITVPNGDGLGDACDPDIDNDGLTNAVEASIGPAGANHALCPSATGNTDPLKSDTDGDGVLDGAECALGSDPTDATSKPVRPLAADDPDRDGLSTAFELSIGSDPTKGDTDGDGIPDGIEYKGYGTSLTSTDTDGDGCSDGREIASVDSNTLVNSLDLLLLANRLNRRDQPLQDVNKDGVVNSGDLALVARNFVGTLC